MTNVLVGGKKREDVLRAYKSRLDNQSMESADPPQVFDADDFSKEFSIQDRGTFWRINGVSFEGDFYQVDHDKGLMVGIDQEVVNQTQEAWSTYSQSNIRASSGTYQPRIPEILPTYVGIWETLRGHANHPTYGPLVEQARLGIRAALQDTRIITLSQINYNPPGQLDELLHWFDNPTPRKIQAPLTGPTGQLANLANSDTISTHLTGLNSNDLHRLTSWLFNRSPLLARNGNPPQHQLTTVVEFGITTNDNNAYIQAIQGPLTFEGPTLGIRTRIIPINEEGE